MASTWSKNSFHPALLLVIIAIFAGFSPTFLSPKIVFVWLSPASSLGNLPSMGLPASAWLINLLTGVVASLNSSTKVLNFPAVSGMANISSNIRLPTLPLYISTKGIFPYLPKILFDSLNLVILVLPIVFLYSSAASANVIFNGSFSAIT